MYWSVVKHRRVKCITSNTISPHAHAGLRCQMNVCITNLHCVDCPPRFKSWSFALSIGYLLFAVRRNFARSLRRCLMMCLPSRSSRPSFQAFVSDKCPECQDSDLDFSKAGDGRWDIEWNFVKCPVASSPSFVFQGSNDFYWKIQPRGTAYPVNKMVMNGGIEGVKTDDNHFEFTYGGPFEGSQTIKMWTIGGEYFDVSVSRN